MTQTATGVFIPSPGFPCNMFQGAMTQLFSGTSGNGVTFSFAPGGDHSTPTLNLFAVLTGSPSAVTMNLQESGDGGTTWQTAPNGGSLDFHATLAQNITVVPGKLYRINTGTITGGTNVTINGSLS